MGEYITINGQPFKVVGYYEAVDLEGWNELDNIIVLPYTFNRSMNNNYNIDSYVVKAKSAQATVEAMTKLDAFLNGLFPMNADGNRDNGSFYVNSNNSSAEQVQSQSNMQSLVLGAIAGISLLVGGIGIMNIMLVTVTERTREIGIRKAIGAERRSIIVQFLIEAAMICGIGGLFGIGVGYIGTMVAESCCCPPPPMCCSPAPSSPWGPSSSRWRWASSSACTRPSRPAGSSLWWPCGPNEGPHHPFVRSFPAGRGAPEGRDFPGTQNEIGDQRKTGDMSMKLKRILAALLTAAALLSLALPAAASGGSFSDINDHSTAVNVDVLRLMGAVSGDSDGTFRPNDVLTRAQFCTMLVGLLRQQSKVPMYTTRTIFSDVTASHWARGYINLAASITVGGAGSGSGSSSEGGEGTQAQTRLISGRGDGTFAPDEKITFAEAVTILIRLLSYDETDAGAVWPEGYLNLANSLGLTDGVSLAYSAPITRAQTAQLFVNTLRCKTASGRPYYETLGASVKEKVILLDANATAEDNNSEGAIRTSDGTYLPAQEGVVPSALQGRRGVLVLDDKDRIVTFLPDETASVTVTLSGAAQPTYLTGTNGTRYNIDGDTPAYTSSKENPVTTYEKLYLELRSGSQVTLYTADGKVVGLYYGSSGASTDAVVVSGTATEAMFHQLTGGASNYTIEKNGQTITMADIQPYDVVTYDSVANKLIVSDLRLPCVYESAEPNPRAPQKITVLGHEFTVLESALESIQSFDVGKTVVLLLTADGNVAGMAEPGAKTRSTAIGLAEGSSVKVFLPAGGTIELKSSSSLSDSVKDQLVTVSSSKAGVISASRMSDRSVGGVFDLQKMTLGSYPVTAGVHVFERVSGSTVVQLELADIQAHSIPGDKIATYHLNSSDMVDFIILEGATGDAYRYGLFFSDTREVEGDEPGKVSYVRTLRFESPKWSSDFNNRVGYIGDNGVPGGVAVDGDGKLAPGSPWRLWRACPAATSSSATAPPTSTRAARCTRCQQGGLLQHHHQGLVHRR